MIAKDVFKKGNLGIGWVDPDFTKEFGEKEFDVSVAFPTFQKLPRNMPDAAIESELKPGFCTLGDVYAFFNNPPEGTKDGYANLFYFESFVVLVYWDAGRGEWHVDAWRRRGGGWDSEGRVFSPATVTHDLIAMPSDTKTLIALVEEMEGACKKIRMLIGV